MIRITKHKVALASYSSPTAHVNALFLSTIPPSLIKCVFLDYTLFFSLSLFTIYALFFKLIAFTLIIGLGYYSLTPEPDRLHDINSPRQFISYITARPRSYYHSCLRSPC